MSPVGRCWLFAWCAAGSPAGEAAATVLGQQQWSIWFDSSWTKSYWSRSKSHRASSRQSPRTTKPSSVQLHGPTLSRQLSGNQLLWKCNGTFHVLCLLYYRHSWSIFHYHHLLYIFLFFLLLVFVFTISVSFTRFHFSGIPSVSRISSCAIWQHVCYTFSASRVVQHRLRSTSSSGRRPLWSVSIRPEPIPFHTISAVRAVASKFLQPAECVLATTATSATARSKCTDSGYVSKQSFTISHRK